MFPGGTIRSGLPGIVTSIGTTRILFPAPGATSPSPARASEIAHSTTFGFAYANGIAREFVFSKTPSRFAPGSVIVREKLRAPASTTPEVLVVMIKRERNFNPKANDWEFLTISGDMKTIKKREKEGKCQRCHASEAKNDYVFRYPAP